MKVVTFCIVFISSLISHWFTERLKKLKLAPHSYQHNKTMIEYEELICELWKDWDNISRRCVCMCRWTMCWQYQGREFSVLTWTWTTIQKTVRHQYDDAASQLTFEIFNSIFSIYSTFNHPPLKQNSIPTHQVCNYENAERVEGKAKYFVYSWVDCRVPYVRNNVSDPKSTQTQTTMRAFCVCCVYNNCSLYRRRRVAVLLSNVANQTIEFIDRYFRPTRIWQRNTEISR